MQLYSGFWPFLITVSKRVSLCQAHPSGHSFVANIDNIEVFPIAPSPTMTRLIFWGWAAADIFRLSKLVPRWYIETAARHWVSICTPPTSTQGSQAGPPRHWYLQTRHVHHELFCKWHLWSHRGWPACSLQLKYHPVVWRHSEIHLPPPPQRTRKSGHLWLFQGWRFVLH